MRISCDIKLNLKTKEAQDKVKKARSKALKDVMVDIAGDVIKGSPKLTGNNMRMIAYELEGGSVITEEGDTAGIGTKEGEAAIYSTSGYGGFLETGTVKRAATPYFKPALDRNIGKLPKNIKAELT